MAIRSLDDKPVGKSTLSKSTNSSCRDLLGSVAGRVADSSPVLQGDDERWSRIFHRGRREAVKSGRIILQSGGPCDSLYYLESGRVAVTLTWHDGSEKTISLLLPGNIFGETFFFRPDLANATVRAETDSVVYSIGRECVDQLLLTQPSLALSLINILTRKIWTLVKQIEDLRFRSVEGRVASLLYALAAGKAAPGKAVVLSLTHSAIADLVGAHRVSVTNTLQALEERGFIEIRPRKVVVKDVAALSSLGYDPADWPLLGGGTNGQ